MRLRCPHAHHARAQIDTVKIVSVDRVLTSLVPRPRPKEGKGSGIHRALSLGAQEIACHVTIMTTHRLGMATYQPLSRTAIVGYSGVSRDNHM